MCWGKEALAIIMNRNVLNIMANEIVKYEQQFEEIRGIITMHRERALREVNEVSLQMSWTVGRIVVRP